MTTLIPGLVSEWDCIVLIRYIAYIYWTIFECCLCFSSWPSAIDDSLRCI